MGLRGPRARSAAYHLARGTWRRDRHGPKPAETAKAREPNPWDLLRLEDMPRPRALDPIEELLQREGIEITAEDRTKGRA
jgi:hypothetical protein